MVRMVKRLAMVALLVATLGAGWLPTTARAESEVDRARVANGLLELTALHEAWHLLVDYHSRPVDPTKLIQAADAAMLEALRKQGIEPMLDPLDTFADAREAEEALLDRYAKLVDTYPEIEPSVLAHAALRSMADAADDQHTTFVPPERARRVKDGLGTGARPSFGAVVAGLNWTIADVYAGSPAAAAGLRRGDRLVATADGPLPERRSARPIEMFCDLGERERLTVQRVGTETLQEVALDCAEVRMPLVEARVVDGLGYVRLRSFGRETAGAEVVAVLRDLEAQRVRGLILDLRGNQGGIIEQGVELLRALVPDGPIYQQSWRDTERTTRLLCAPPYTTRVTEQGLTLGDEEPDAGCTEPPLLSLPLTVLVDDYSASTSEIVAATLQERGRARLFGTTTAGAVALAYILPLSDDALLELSAWQVLSGHGRPLDGVGVRPDEEVALDYDLLARGVDAPLQRAIAYLHTAAQPVAPAAAH